MAHKNQLFPSGSSSKPTGREELNRTLRFAVSKFGADRGLKLFNEGRTLEELQALPLAESGSKPARGLYR